MSGKPLWTRLRELPKESTFRIRLTAGVVVIAPSKSVAAPYRNTVRPPRAPEGALCQLTDVVSLCELTQNGADTERGCARQTCRVNSTAACKEYDLIVIGAGSGNSIIVPEMDDWRIAMVEHGRFGGTCMNRGCIPSKMLIYPADLAEHAKHGDRLGLRTQFNGADWPQIVERVFGRIDAIAEAGRQYRLGLSNVDVYESTAHFVGDRELEVGGQRIRGDQVVIAAGAHSFVPDLPGIHDVAFHTSDTIMRIEQLPERLIILGGGFIATELGHVFQALGSKVTIINRSLQLLRTEDEDISHRFTQVAAHRFDLVLGSTVKNVYSTANGVGVDVESDSGQGKISRKIEGDVLLVAAGRVPNSAQLHVAAGGVEIDADGAVVVDEFGRTSAPRVWALGDINGRHQLKHMANGEARVVTHNLLHPDDLRRFDQRPAPHAVFSNPQIGSIGFTEREARERGGPYVTACHSYGDTAYGWAMEDTTGFCKLIGDPRTRQVTGAHIVGYQASMLVQLLVQGMHLGTTADAMAVGQVWIHPALPEVVENTLLKLVAAFDTAAQPVATD
ncbi:MAG: mycothione reductase [Actinobacteria bacterium]|nr:mycothione reductase [Actinomycetota bacterium]